MKDESWNQACRRLAKQAAAAHVATQDCKGLDLTQLFLSECLDYSSLKHQFHNLLHTKNFTPVMDGTQQSVNIQNVGGWFF